MLKYQYQNAVKLNVDCKCMKGKLLCLDMINDGDHYIMACDSCDNTFTVHYTGYDCLCEQSQYNDQMNDDIRTLNANGSWIYETGKASAEKLENTLNGAKKIHSIDDGYEIYNFYQKGASFFSTTFNSVHNTTSLSSYRANEDCMANLIKHFFKGVK